MIDDIENDAQLKKEEKEKQGKIEEQLCLCATSGLNLSS